MALLLFCALSSLSLSLGFSRRRFESAERWVS